MTILDRVLARLAKLPPERQEAMALELDLLLDEAESEFALTPAQEAELDRRMARTEDLTSQEEVFSALREKLGK